MTRSRSRSDRAPDSCASTIADGFEGRWIAEAIGAGDIVVPFIAPSAAFRGDAAARPISFVVFWRGSPPDSVEMVLRTWLASRYDMTADAIDGVIATYRAITGAAP